MAFISFHHFQSRTSRRQYLSAWFRPAAIWLLVCIGIWYLADRAEGRPWRTFLALTPLFAGVPLYLAYFPWAYRRKIRQVITGMVNEGHNRSLWGWHRVGISSQGITDASEFHQSSTAWRAVERIARNSDYLFIYVSALSAIIVPRRAFDTVAEFEAFEKAAEAFHKSSRS